MAQAIKSENAILNHVTLRKNYNRVRAIEIGCITAVAFAAWSTFNWVKGEQLYQQQLHELQLDPKVAHYKKLREELKVLDESADNLLNGEKAVSVFTDLSTKKNLDDAIKKVQEKANTDRTEISAIEKEEDIRAWELGRTFMVEKTKTSDRWSIKCLLSEVSLAVGGAGLLMWPLFHMIKKCYKEQLQKLGEIV